MAWLLALKMIMTLTLTLLFGLLLAILAAVGYYVGAPATLIVVAAVVLVVIQWAISPYFLWWTVNMRPIKRDEKEYGWIFDVVERICKKTKTPFPKKIALARVGEPNAFVFGRWPSDATLAVTQGLLNNLTREEAEAVIGHEIGHIKHKDMVVMTIAGSVPVIMYFIARFLIWAPDRRDRSAGAAIVIGMAAFAIYFISQLIVMWLSRSREYYADAFSAEKYGKPGLLASALAKITYGLGTSTHKETGPVRAFCIGDSDSATLEIAHFSKEYADFQLTSKELQDALEWEKRNPLIRFMEVFRTHPLCFKRIARLMELEKELKKS